MTKRIGPFLLQQLMKSVSLAGLLQEYVTSEHDLYKKQALIEA